MLISKHWLEDFVFLPDSLRAEDLARELTLATVEVESLRELGAGLDKIVVGVVKVMQKHPQADKLSVCQVDVGRENLQVVCGGSNLRLGMRVALARVGARVIWHGTGEPVELKVTSIRGVESHGMICASDEIGLAQMFPKSSEREIIDLAQFKVKSGTPLAVALNLDDVIFDIDNKSLTHRPDLWGHYGLAREISALECKKFKVLKPAAIKSGREMKLSVIVKEPELCPRYMAVAVYGINVAPSPEWLSRRLRAVGLRSINNIVDITNYVMLELGQPMHAFDARHVAKDKSGARRIIVRRARAGERFTTLDNENYELEDKMLVIADETRALALAGVKGGANSGVSDDTTEIIFEAATFNGSSIRATSLSLGLRTDSSARFEKNLDPELPKLALARAIELTRRLCDSARVSSPVADERHYRLSSQRICLPFVALEKKLGLKIERKQVIEILTRLGFGVKNKKNELLVSVPSWRAGKDIQIMEDLVEEIVRVYGYERVQGRLPSVAIVAPKQNRSHSLFRKVRAVLSMECGASEVYNYSFVAPEWLSSIGFLATGHMELDNPIAKDKRLLQRSLLLNLLKNVEENAHSFSSVRLFEIGHVFISENAGERAKHGSNELLPSQPAMLGLIVADQHVATSFFAVSGAVVRLMERLGVSARLIKDSAPFSFVHPGRAARIMIDGLEIGYIGELHPSAQESSGIPYRCAFAELNLVLLLSKLKDTKAPCVHLPDYPSVTRDIAFLIDKSFTHAEVADILLSSHPLVRAVELFDVYEGDGVPSGKKSLAYHIIYQADERTLTADEIDDAHSKASTILKNKFNAETRVS